MPRAIPKGESDTSREMFDRYSLTNGTAIQIHWPSSIEVKERVDLSAWLDLMASKILTAAKPTDTGYYEQVPPQKDPDWKVERDRTKEAMANRIVEVPDRGTSAPWNMCPYCSADISESCGVHVCSFGTDSLVDSSTVNPLDIPPPAPSTLKKYFAGCHCDECCKNYRVAGVQYVDATMPGYDEHMAVNVKTAAFPAPVPIEDEDAF